MTILDRSNYYLFAIDQNNNDHLIDEVLRERNSIAKIFILLRLIYLQIFLDRIAVVPESVFNLIAAKPVGKKQKHSDKNGLSMKLSKKMKIEFEHFQKKL